MDRSTSSWAPPAQIDRLRLQALIVGAVGAGASVVGAFADGEQFFQSYITAFLWVLAAPLGALGLIMLHHLTRGAWGVVIRRILEASSRTLPLMALFFVPILLGRAEIFHWSHAELFDPASEHYDSLIAGKSWYLNMPFFIGRAVLYFLVWIGFTALLNRKSALQDETGDIAHARSMQAWSAGGIVIFMLTVSFAAFDWLMSLDAHWFSSIYGVYYAIGAALTALAFTIAISVWLARREPMSEVFRASHFHDFGKLMLAFLMLWAYFSVSQLIIIWSGNLPEEVGWYISRTTGMWAPFPYIIIVLHFALPFVLLLSTDLKRDARRLVVVAVFILLMRLADMFWQAGPSLGMESWHWMDVALPVGLGGLWLAFFFTHLKRRPLIPRNEPFLEEALGHHG